MNANVPLARKLILHSPVSNEAALASLVERCLEEGVSLIAIVGQGSVELESQIDSLIVGDGSHPGRFICTTSHPDDAYDAVVNMVECWELDRRDPYRVVRL